MNTEISRKQRLKFFFLNIAAFAGIFLLLGFYNSAAVAKLGLPPNRPVTDSNGGK